MAWKEGIDYHPRPGEVVEGGEGRSVGGPERTGEGREYSRGEMPVVTDAQVGGSNLERGPERANPEGSVDISNRDYREGGSGPGAREP